MSQYFELHILRLKIFGACGGRPGGSAPRPPLGRAPDPTCTPCVPPTYTAAAKTISPSMFHPILDRLLILYNTKYRNIDEYSVSLPKSCVLYYTAEYSCRIGCGRL